VARFAFSFQPAYRPLASVLGLGPRWSRIDVDGDAVHVAMGWGFRARLARSAVSDVERPARRPLSRGVHGWRGDWLVNASAEGLVTLVLDPPGRGRVLGWPVGLRRLTLSLADPDGFVAALGRP
jgi:hypothetical protein